MLALKFKYTKKLRMLQTIVKVRFCSSIHPFTARLHRGRENKVDAEKIISQTLLVLTLGDIRLTVQPACHVFDRRGRGQCPSASGSPAARASVRSARPKEKFQISDFG
jgi:hypothetical protein